MEDRDTMQETSSEDLVRKIRETIALLQAEAKKSQSFKDKGDTSHNFKKSN